MIVPTHVMTCHRVSGRIKCFDLEKFIRRVADLNCSRPRIKSLNCRSLTLEHLAIESIGKAIILVFESSLFANTLARK